ncbi:MAG: DUF1552 domain-containing protein [Sandaracinaceae bacterium]
MSKKLHRRRFLRGLGGAVVALPFLESVMFVDSSPARAAGSRDVFTVFVKQGNGVQQAWSSEPDRFWPHDLGTLTRDILTNRDGDRAVSELAAYAEDLLMVKGTRFAFPGEGCGHSGGINQCLTAGRVTGSGNTSLGGNESVDWRIGVECNPPGVEALSLISGEFGYVSSGLSYSGSGSPRAAQNNPFNVYSNLFGTVGMDTEIQNALAARRLSVNDLVRGEMRDLLGNPDLGSADRSRLETHFDAIRDLEVTMSCELGGADVGAMMTIRDAVNDNGNRLTVTRMMMDITALVFACDLNRSVTIQIGGCNDGTRYMVDGVLQNTFHRISHRIDDDGSDGPPIPNADLLHHKIDRIMAQQFVHLLDRLSTYAGPNSPRLLDDCIAVWTNDLSNGPPHSYNNIPQIIAGTGGGFLRKGQYIDAGNVTHNKFLNTILAAHGIMDSSGDYYRFGDSSLEPGIIPGMLAT